MMESHVTLVFRSQLNSGSKNICPINNVFVTNRLQVSVQGLIFQPITASPTPMLNIRFPLTDELFLFSATPT